MALGGFLILSRARSGRVEGRTALIPPLFGWFTASKAGVHRRNIRFEAVGKSLRALLTPDEVPVFKRLRSYLENGTA
jgi:hypothetical protein